MRYFIQLAYLGTPFFGWQRQPDQISVQEVLEEALSTILRTPTTITGAGRTDTGVHATDMWAHFDMVDTYTKLNSEKLTYKLNSYLDQNIAIKTIVPVSNEAHARFDALSRSYIYKICAVKDPFRTNKAYYLKTPLAINAMNEACEILKSYEDFECFSKVKTNVKTYLCRISEAYWFQENEMLYFSISANRFLRNMVRAIVGTLIDVGLQKKEPNWLHELIQSKSRSIAGTSVPAHGLYLTEVKYPKNLFLENE